MTKSDLLDESHFPVLLFNDLIEDSFLQILTECLVKGVGFGVDYGACTFPNDLDDYDKATGVPFDGIEFGTHKGDEILLDYKTFYHYLKLICDRFSDGKLQDKDVINKALLDFGLQYDIILPNNC